MIFLLARERKHVVILVSIGIRTVGMCGYIARELEFVFSARLVEQVVDVKEILLQIAFRAAMKEELNEHP